MIQAFVDESEGTKEGKILLLSACIHFVSAWEAFSNDWERALQCEPRIDSFHMREARPLQGQFSGWKAIDRDLKIVSLVDVIMRHEPHVVSCYLSRDDYNEIMHGIVPYDMRHAYFKCFAAIVVKVADYLNIRGISTPADYIFDDKGHVGNEALLWYDALKDGAPEHIRKLMGSTPVFRKDTDVLPLQAADLIAWHKRRKKEFGGLDPESAATLRIDDLPGGEIHLTREHLLETARAMSAVPNVELTIEGPSLYQSLKRAFKKAKIGGK